MLEFLVHLLVVMIVVGLVLWILPQLNISDQLGEILPVVVMVLAAIWLIYAFLSVVGTVPRLL